MLNQQHEDTVCVNDPGDSTNGIEQMLLLRGRDLVKVKKLLFVFNVEKYTEETMCTLQIHIRLAVTLFLLVLKYLSVVTLLCNTLTVMPGTVQEDLEF